jgi:hypothetical protein
MKSNILYITHPTFNVSTINNNSKLLDKPIDQLANGDYHTSVCDMTVADIISAAKQFESIHFVSDNFNTADSIYHETVILLSYLQHQMPVINFITPPIQTFVDDHLDIISRTNDPTLWVFGCSHSNGIGLSSKDLRYSNILSQWLNMPLNSISRPGSSTRWSLRHLINANLHKSDLVIWQLTTPDRISSASKYPFEILLSKTDSRALLEVYDKEQIYFDHLSLINYGVRYLRAAGIKFIITSIEYDSTLFYDYKKEYVKYKEYCYSPGFDVDFGNDHVHFGELSHKNLALSIQDHIQYIYG